MMKRMLIVSIALAVVASSAMAASLVKINPVGTNTTSGIFAITNDGAYASGHGTGATSDRAFIYKVSDGSVITNILAGSYLSSGAGIAYRINPTTNAQELLAGGKQSSGQVGIFLSTDGGATWSRPLSSAGTAPATAAANAVGGGGAGMTDTGWLGWVDNTIQNYQGKISGDPIVTQIFQKDNASGQTAYINGVSNVGRLVGARKASTGQRQNMYMTNGSQTLFNGMDGTTTGIASAISGDGNWIFGQSPIVGDTTANRPYKKDVVGGSITALPLLPGTTGSTSLGYVYGASEDGRYGVGMDYVGTEMAALWDTQAGTVIDLTQYCIDNGILGDFTRLTRAYTVGVNALGQPVIGGIGATAGGTRGFILTIPEPATLSFLVLGGLALLRRRR